MRVSTASRARRTPTAVLEARGSNKHRKDREAARAAEPVAVGEIGPAPAWMTPEEKLAWDELVELCCAGVLAKVDRVIVEQGACLLVRLRACHYNIDPKYMIRMEHVLACLGMTPADRSRVKVPKGTKPKSPYDE